MWWPAARALILADTHWGKSETLRAGGAPIPGGVLEEQLARLARLAAATRAERALVVGDLLHARAGLTSAMVEAVGAWLAATGLRLEVVPGNHDRSIEGVAGPWSLVVRGTVHDEGPFRFAHHPPARGSSLRYTWSGHEHPGVRLAGGGDALRLPCYWLRPRVGVLPAFSRFTGRGSLRRGPRDCVFAIAGDRVVQTP